MLTHPPRAGSLPPARPVGVTRPLIIVPTYNEADNLPSLVDNIGRVARATERPFDILVVDDGSPDGTADIADQLGHRRPNLHVLRRHEKSGLGDAYRAGFQWGMSRGYDVLIEMDADHSHPADALPHLLAAIDDGADLAIGSRYVPGGTTVGWAWSRRLLSRAGNRYVSLLLSLGVEDATAGFRAYRPELLERIDALGSVSNGYSFQVELTWSSHRAGAVICEVPITFTERQVGSSKMSGRIAFEALARVAAVALTRGRRGFAGRSADRSKAASARGLVRLTHGNGPAEL